MEDFSVDVFTFYTLTGLLHWKQWLTTQLKRFNKPQSKKLNIFILYFWETNLEVKNSSYILGIINRHLSAPGMSFGCGNFSMLVLMMPPKFVKTSLRREQPVNTWPSCWLRKRSSRVGSTDWQMSRFQMIWLSGRQSTESTSARTSSWPSEAAWSTDNFGPLLFHKFLRIEIWTKRRKKIIFKL